MKVNDDLYRILNEYGVTITESGQLEDIDSITFITLIVKLEEVYKITFPDEILMLDSLKNIETLSTIIEQQIGE